MRTALAFTLTLLLAALAGIFLTEPGAAAPPAPRDYHFTWYDDAGGRDWILMANPASAVSDLNFTLSIAGAGRELAPLSGTGCPALPATCAPGQVPAGRTLTPRYAGLTGGPVIVQSSTSDRAVVSQRILWGGRSLEEVPAVDGQRLDSHYYWTWYDMQTAGYTDWVLVANPGGSPVYYEIWIGGQMRGHGDLAASDRVTPTFPGVIGGPVEVRAYTDSGKSAAADVMASQRVLTGYGNAFNEVPGIPASELSDRYYWTWYDQQSAGARNWVLVANPGGSQVYYEIRVAGTLWAAGDIQAGQNVTPTFPGVLGGPVEVQAWTDSGKTAPADVIASQRSLWGPSFEEVPGFPAGQLSSGYHWTWYDNQSAGSTNWVLVANPNGRQIYYEISIAGDVHAAGVINPGQKATPTFPGIMSGPVEVQAWTDSGKATRAPAIASQRVTWSGYFNEVLGVPEDPAAVIPSSLNPALPPAPVKLVFVHHSTGENWITDGNGNLGQALTAANYFVSDTNYGWGPADADVGSGTIGDHTDIGHWYNWFAGPHRDTYMTSLFAESGQHSSYTRMGTDPGGANEIVMFKSCFPNSALAGNPGDAATSGANPLRGQDAGSARMTVANVKGIYNDLLPYFAAHQEKLFIIVTAPPLDSGATNASQAANARAVNNWLVDSWLAGYPHNNVAVFDFYDVLTSNGGNANTNDLGQAGGNHHRYNAGVIEHITSAGINYSAYTAGGDSHPTSAGSLKATGEFVTWLNVVYNRWQGL